MLPNFPVIGTMKGGTSSVCRYLLDHPQIFMSPVKEPMFCSRNWDRGLEWYERLFDRAGEAVAIGECPPSTRRIPTSQKSRCASGRHSLRFASYMIRHPIERMLSEYHDYMVRGVERDPLAERALLGESFYCNVSRYAMQIERYLEYFSRDQLLILKSEDLKSDRAQTLRRVYEFLGVDGSYQPTHLEQEFHATSKRRGRRSVDYALRRIPGYGRIASVSPRSVVRLKTRLTTRKAPPRPRLSEDARREIEDRLRDDVLRLRRYMGDDFNGRGLA